MITEIDAFSGSSKIHPRKWPTHWDTYIPIPGGPTNGGKREKSEDIVLKLRQVEVLQGQGKPLADVVRQIGVKSMAP